MEKWHKREDGIYKGPVQPVLEAQPNEADEVPPDSPYQPPPGEGAVVPLDHQGAVIPHLHDGIPEFHLPHPEGAHEHAPAAHQPAVDAAHQQDGAVDGAHEQAAAVQQPAAVAHEQAEAVANHEAAAEQQPAAAAAAAAAHEQAEAVANHQAADEQQLAAAEAAAAAAAHEQAEAVANRQSAAEQQPAASAHQHAPSASLRQNEAAAAAAAQAAAHHHSAAAAAQQPLGDGRGRGQRMITNLLPMSLLLNLHLLNLTAPSLFGSLPFSGYPMGHTINLNINSSQMQVMNLSQGLHSQPSGRRATDNSNPPCDLSIASSGKYQNVHLDHSPNPINLEHKTRREEDSQNIPEESANKKCTASLDPQAGPSFQSTQTQTIDSATAPIADAGANEIEISNSDCTRDTNPNINFLHSISEPNPTLGRQAGLPEPPSMTGGSSSQRFAPYRRHHIQRPSPRPQLDRSQQSQQSQPNARPPPPLVVVDFILPTYKEFLASNGAPADIRLSTTFSRLDAQPTQENCPTESYPLSSGHSQVNPASYANSRVSERDTAPETRKPTPQEQSTVRKSIFGSEIKLDTQETQSFCRISRVSDGSTSIIPSPSTRVPNRPLSGRSDVNTSPEFVTPANCEILRPMETISDNNTPPEEHASVSNVARTSGRPCSNNTRSSVSHQEVRPCVSHAPEQSALPNKPISESDSNRALTSHCHSECKCACDTVSRPCSSSKVTVDKNENVATPEQSSYSLAEGAPVNTDHSYTNREAEYAQVVANEVQSISSMLSERIVRVHHQYYGSALRGEPSSNARRSGSSDQRTDGIARRHNRTSSTGHIFVPLNASSTQSSRQSLHPHPNIAPDRHDNVPSQTRTPANAHSISSTISHAPMYGESSRARKPTPPKTYAARHCSDYVTVNSNQHSAFTNQQAENTEAATTQTQIAQSNEPFVQEAAVGHSNEMYQFDTHGHDPQLRETSRISEHNPRASTECGCIDAEEEKGEEKPLETENQEVHRCNVPSNTDRDVSVNNRPLVSCHVQTVPRLREPYAGPFPQTWASWQLIPLTRASGAAQPTLTTTLLAPSSQAPLDARVVNLATAPAESSTRRWEAPTPAQSEATSALQSGAQGRQQSAQSSTFHFSIEPGTVIGVQYLTQQQPRTQTLDWCMPLPMVYPDNNMERHTSAQNIPTTICHLYRNCRDADSGPITPHYQSQHVQNSHSSGSAASVRQDRVPDSFCESNRTNSHGDGVDRRDHGVESQPSPGPRAAFGLAVSETGTNEPVATGAATSPAASTSRTSPKEEMDSNSGSDSETSHHKLFDSSAKMPRDIQTKPSCSYNLRNKLQVKQRASTASSSSSSTSTPTRATTTPSTPKLEGDDSPSTGSTPAGSVMSGATESSASDGSAPESAPSEYSDATPWRYPESFPGPSTSRAVVDPSWPPQRFFHCSSATTRTPQKKKQGVCKKSKRRTKPKYRRL